MDVRAKRQAWIDVRAWGATGDGVTFDTRAIQHALEMAADVPSPVYLPAGVYRLDEPLAGHSGLEIVGDPWRTTLVQAENDAAILDVRTGADVGPVTLRGLMLRATGEGCYGVRGEAADWYLTGLRASECSFYADLAHGVVGKLALCTFNRCFFGHHGVAGDSFQPVWAGNIDGARYAFSNVFRDCKFVRAKSCDGAVQLGTGHATEFENCIWEAITVPAIHARGMTSILLLNPTFEAINPSSGENCIMDIADDGLGGNRYVRVRWIGGRCSQAAGMTDAVAFCDAGSHVEIENAILNVQGYITERAGPQYDRNASVSLCQLIGYAGTAFRSEERGLAGVLNLRGVFPLRIPAVAAEPGFPQEHNLYMDDGTNRGDRVRGWRYYDGTAFRDLGHSGGRATHSYGGGTATWELTEKEADASLFWVTAAGGAAVASFPTVRPGKNFTVYNGSGHAITFRVGAAGGEVATNAKYSIWTMTSTNCAKIYEQP
ncbi:MAG: glycosyl hydrolase family 28-related protein [Zavarzinia sp.]|nr:glycosyl hydrolase family 28-related protein [Zavarzinia sp.]